MKRNRLEIIQDILKIIQKNHNEINKTPLIRRTNLSTSRFKEYYLELIKKNFIKEERKKSEITISITKKGFRFLEKYKTILNFINEFEL
jgi:predicted transcriptional regulator